MIATLPRLTEAEINEQYNGRWVLLTDFVEDPQTMEWTQAVVLADAPPEDNSALFELDANWAYSTRESYLLAKILILLPFCYENEF